MKKKRFTEEQIVRILRDAEAKTIEAAARQHGVSEQSIYRWKRNFGQMDVAAVRELRHLRQENVRLKKVLAERDLEVEVMKELQAKKWSAHGHDATRPRPPVRVGSVHGERHGSVRLLGRESGRRPRVLTGIGGWPKPSVGWPSGIRSGAIDLPGVFFATGAGG